MLSEMTNLSKTSRSDLCNDDEKLFANISLALHPLSRFPPPPPSSLTLPVCVSVCLSPAVCLPTVCLLVSQSVSHSVSQSVSHSVSQSVNLSVRPSVRSSVHP